MLADTLIGYAIQSRIGDWPIKCPHVYESYHGTLILIEEHIPHSIVDFVAWLRSGSTLENPAKFHWSRKESYTRHI